ncbi:MAG: hypothetical protein ACRDCE_13785 [Cetobacterium sp.]|uniref:hypothetical protein n=1 Tax=Cetobacterium sp. TaxID=2071632 RepID=UPI003EE6899B
MSVEFYHKPKGFKSMGWNPSLVLWGWQQKEIFQHRRYLEFFLTTEDALCNEELYEWVEINDRGVVQASMIVAEDFDQHVGRCLSVRWALTKEKGKLTKAYRKLYELAKELGIPFICHTQEVSPYVYTMRYRKVKL